MGFQHPKFFVQNLQEKGRYEKALNSTLLEKT
jgi:hypothetical protein